jgi:hypothetical protein
MPPRKRGIPRFNNEDEEREFWNNVRMQGEDTIRLMKYGETDENGQPFTDRDIDNANLFILRSELGTRMNPEIRNIFVDKYNLIKKHLGNPDEYYTKPNEYIPEGMLIQRLPEEDADVYYSVFQPPENTSKFVYQFDSDSEEGAGRSGGSFIQPINRKSLPFF